MKAVVSILARSLPHPLLYYTKRTKEANLAVVSSTTSVKEWWLAQFPVLGQYVQNLRNGLSPIASGGHLHTHTLSTLPIYNFDIITRMKKKKSPFSDREKRM